MNIGFYGHSNCAYRSEDSFLDIVAKELNAKIVNQGVRQGSEERILFELKKTHNLDYAILFHCLPKFLFLPECDRDINVHDIEKQRAEYLFKEDNLTNYNVAPKFNEIFENNENFFNAINVYKDYFYHADLMTNRYFGALIQIDQYLKFRNIPAIHVIVKKHPFPNWFSFTHGKIDYDIMDIVMTHEAKNPFFVNCVSKEGNKLIADILLNIMKCGS